MNAVHKYFKTEEKGKLIMTCSTGKTFISLKIAENEINSKGLILFLVPLIALIGQSLRKWASQAEKPIKAICICSDSEVSKQKLSDEENVDIENLALLALTNVENIMRQFENIDKFKKFDDKNISI